MIITLNKGESPYSKLSSVVEQITDRKTDVYIARIKTSVLGEDKIVMMPTDFGYEFDNDWYEGGELELLGLIGLRDIEIPDLAKEE